MFILWEKTHVVTEFDLVHFVDMKRTCLSCIGFLQWLVTTPSFEELHNLNHLHAGRRYFTRSFFWMPGG